MKNSMDEKDGILDYSYQELEEWPPEIIQKADLKELDISCNNVETLLLNNNLINELPSDIGNLDKLKVLNLSENRLFNLPKSLGLLNQLEELCLDYNSISDIKMLATLNHLKKLEYITYSFS